MLLEIISKLEEMQEGWLNTAQECKDFGDTTGAAYSRGVATGINDSIEKLKDANIWVYGLELGGRDLYKTNLTGRIAIVIGGEDTGINRLTKEKCDGVMSIKMHGKINSLNASVATGVAVFEALRQRQA